MTRPLHDAPADVATLLARLAAALDGSGPAVAAGGAAGEGAQVPDEVAVVVATSGSTGEPRSVLLDATALRASATATADRLSGPGQWLLALPPTHVAGIQVLVRSALAGTVPVALDPGPFRPEAFVAAARRMHDGTRYASLVPTQLVRLLDDPTATAALTGLDAVLLGGAAAPASLLESARDAGVPVVTTYGMSETCGGCVYDGVPLDGVEVTIEDGLIHLAGPVLARGYLGRPDLDAETFVVSGGVRRLRTRDLGRVDGGRLSVLGRADDVIVTGGVNVAPAAVEAAIAELAGVAEVCVVGVPDAEWGQVVVAAVVGAVPQSPAPTLEQVRSHVRRRLDAAHAPRHLVLLDSLPQRGPGKHDRRTLAATLAARFPDPTDRRTST